MRSVELDGNIVEFLDSGALRIGYVRRRDHRKAQIVDPRGRETSVPVSRIIVVHQACAENDFREIAGEIVERVRSRAGEIDVELLWESTSGEGPTFSVEQLATHYFGDAAPESGSAVFRALEANTMFFRRNALLFEARPADQVAAERLRVRREVEKSASRDRIAGLLRRALRGDIPAADHAEWAKIEDQLERWLRGNENNEAATIFEQITGEPQAREIAYDLLLGVGRLTPLDDRFLLVRGVPTAFGPEVVAAADKLESPPDTRKRVDWTMHPTVTIDDEETVEIDDALTVVEESDGTTIGIHIADVACFVRRGDALDAEALRRTATIYLANVSVPMFPTRLSSDLSSLVEGKPRPAFTVVARFDPTCALIGARVERTVVRVTERLTYEKADAWISERHPHLTRLEQIAAQLMADRVEAGAQTHRRPEIKVRVENDRIDIRRVESDTPSRLVVSEMMIMANQLVADYAVRERIHVIYRTQEPPEQTPPVNAGMPEPLRFEAARKGFKRSRLSLSPAPHAGLGLSAYTQMSSPIRRYVDLVTQQQLTAHLDGNRPPYDEDALLAVINIVETSEVEIRRLEQASTTYWILEYLSRNRMHEPMPAIVLDLKGNVELTEYLVRGKVTGAVDRNPGTVIDVRIDKVKPVSGSLTLSMCE